MRKFPCTYEESVDLRGTFTLVSVRYTSVGSSAGWVPVGKVGRVTAVQVRSTVISQGSG